MPKKFVGKSLEICLEKWGFFSVWEVATLWCVYYCYHWGNTLLL